MNTLTIVLLIYVILDIIISLILIVIVKRKGLTDLSWRLKWLCKREQNEDEIVEHYEDYFFDEDEVDDQGYGY